MENPGKGEFRYLWFAWKPSGGEGIMIELAADGRWPRALLPGSQSNALVPRAT